MQGLDVYIAQDWEEKNARTIARLEESAEFWRCVALDELYADMIDSDWPALPPVERIPF